MATGVDYLSPTLEKGFLNKPEGVGMYVCTYVSSETTVILTGPAKINHVSVKNHQFFCLSSIITYILTK